MLHLILGVVHHLGVGAVRGSKEVRWDLVPGEDLLRKSFFQAFSVQTHTPPFADVHLASPLGIDGVPLVGVDDDAEES